MIDIIKAIVKPVFKPNTAWLSLFLPALFYYMGTRLYSMGLFRSSTYGKILHHELTWVNPTPSLKTTASGNKNSKQTLFYTQSHEGRSSLRYSIYLVQDFDEGSVVSTTWMEDQELGRGYLLLSTSAGSGKVYRWEAGGGPIAIGRTLHLKDSGCRSNLYQKCNVDGMNHERAGSGGIVVDTFRCESLPTLLVAEYGEGRVVRLEENGARTPLIIETRSFDDRAMDESNRLFRPFRLLVTPYGDLMVIDDATARGKDFILWRLPNASYVPGLPSLMVSREAHAWKRNEATTFPQVFFESNAMGGMVLSPSGQGIYVTTIDPDSSSVIVLSLPLLENLNDLASVGEYETYAEGDKEQIDSANNNRARNGVQAEYTKRGLRWRRSKLVFDYKAHAKVPGAIEIDNNGNLYLAVEDGILVVSKSQTSIARITFSTLDEKIVDLTLGSDGFLYIAMESKLARVKVPNYPLEFRKDLLIKA